MSRPVLTLSCALFLFVGLFAFAENDEQGELEREKTSSSNATLSSARKGMWQGGEVALESIPKSDGFGFNSLATSAKLGLPAPIRGHFLLISPSFAWRDVDLSSSQFLQQDDLTLYSVGANVAYVVPRSEQLLYNVAIGVSWNGDGRASDGEAVQVFGTGVALWSPSDVWKWTLGLAYSNNIDWGVVPIMGASWTPNEDWRVDLTFPAPKVARRLDILDASEKTSYWLYCGGGVAGFSGVFEPETESASRSVAKVKYSGWRLSTGLERKTVQGIGGAVEAGATFGQKYELDSLQGQYWREKRRPGANLLLKTKVAF